MCLWPNKHRDTNILSWQPNNSHDINRHYVLFSFCSTQIIIYLISKKGIFMFRLQQYHGFMVYQGI